ncbi:flagellar hook-associated protein 3 [Pseudomonas sp.]|uniref:flagellar hook-associated protein 3 n=1 Tax=Pseudomonas sp. TaxID=306 RepID=UPI0013032489|nr:flagellar hook-associated protein 3 [Pseudomonas sp.]
MRISTGQYFANSLAGYSKNYSDITKTQSEISSGTRIQTAADDPVGASKLLQLQQQSARLTQYTSNITTTNNSLNNEESVLSSINTALQSARELTLQAGNGGLTDDDRASIANQLGDIESTVYGLLNSKDANGNYLFSGSKTNVQPYVKNADGSYTYQGDETQLSLQVSDTLSMATNDTGYSVFEQASNVARTSATLTAPATDDGRMTLTSGNMTSQTTYNSSFKAGEPYTLTFTSASAYTITDASGNDVTAESSGKGTYDSTDASGSTISLRGVDFQANVIAQTGDDDTTDMDAALAGHSFSLASKPDTITASRISSNTSTAQITSASVSDESAYSSTFPNGGAIIKFTSATDYQVYASPVTSSSQAIASGSMTSPATSITAAGVTFNVTGTPASGDQFSVTADAHQTQNVLNTISQLRSVLSTPISGDSAGALRVQNAVAAATGNLDSASNQIDITRGSIGARGNALDIQSAEISSLTLANTATQSSIGDTDTAEASVKLTLQQTMLEASQLAFSRISQLSLFDKI